MRKRFFLSLLAAAVSVSALYAAPVDYATAKRTARDFYTQATFSRGASKAAAEFTCVYPAATKESAGFTPYYIFNVGENGGFVIVAGDDNARSMILAYASKGAFDYANRPAHVDYWLEGYAAQIRSLYGSSSESKGSASKKTYGGGEPVVSPILDSISYNQDDPYNRMCPEYTNDRGVTKRLYTGCAATAMTACCKHFAWPESGRGSISYTTHAYSAAYPDGLGIACETDFSQNVYDWNKILPSYRKGIDYTDEQADAVALIMRDAGYAMRMDYEWAESGATINEALKGAVSHLRYDSATGIRMRAYYDDQEEWENMLKSQLDAGHPIYYAGQSRGGGHAFVFDGYDADNYFHVHWGWGDDPDNPRYDGFYLAYVLNPHGDSHPDDVIGAGEGGYNLDQYVLYNMVPEGKGLRLKKAFQIDVSDDYSCILLKDKDTAVSSFDFNVRRYINWNAADFEGVVALAVYKDREFVQVISEEKRLSLDGILRLGPFMGIPIQSRDVKLTATAGDLEDGNYEIYLATKSDMAGCDWNLCHSSHSGLSAVSYIPVTVENGKFKYRSIEHKLNLTVHLPISRNISYQVYRSGALVGGTNHITSNTETAISLLSGELYSFVFSTGGFNDYSLEDLILHNDTAITVNMQETMCDPYIYAVTVKQQDINFYWQKQHPSETDITVVPRGYIIYLDSVPVATAGSYAPANYGTYVFENMEPGWYNVGVRSVYYEDSSNLITRNVQVKEVANEDLLSSQCALTPNPSSDGRFILEVPCACRVQVCSLSGMVLREIGLGFAGKHTLDLSGYTSGMYLIRLFTEDRQSLVLKAFIK